jgi:phospholipase/carboxylesterase
MTTHKKEIVTSGQDLRQASKVLIMIHGRGASAEDILGIANHLKLEDFALLAPQATNNTWYPYSFLAPPSQNEPWLTSALDLLNDTVSDLKKNKIDPKNIYFLGFSQGACLTLEYVTRNATKYGGVVAFTGGLIGDKIYTENYKGDFSGTPLFIGTSDPDPHVPVERVNATEKILTGMNAQVVKKIYANMGHTINQDEINFANQILWK